MNAFLATTLFWFLLGIFFFFAETLHSAFILFFFGVGAFIVAIVTWLGLTSSPSVQVVLFALTSFLSLVLFRRTLSKTFRGGVRGIIQPGQFLDDFRGQKAIALSEFDNNTHDGKVEYHGTVWNAESDERIEKGESVEVIERI